MERAAMPPRPPARHPPRSPQTTDDFVRFFEGEGFMDNPLWATCYCMFPNFTGTNEEWSERTGEANLADKVALFKSGDAHGLLAFGDEGQPAAWCAAGPKAEMGNLPAFSGQARRGGRHRLDLLFRCRTALSPPGRRGPPARSRVRLPRSFGLTVAEAYPAKSTTDAHAFNGPLEMYLQAGFTAHGEAGDRVVVRRSLEAT
jgi:hypothetical protein